jgi:hypothetical protein
MGINVYEYILAYITYKYLDHAERRKLVLEFVRTHQGCMKEQIVEGLKNEVSRVPLFDTLNELLLDNTLRDESENRRDHKLFVNSDNPLVSVPEDLGRFEEAYISLLHKSMKRIDEKDFSALFKSLAITESDPARWNDSEVAKYRSLEFERWKKTLELGRKNVDHLRRLVHPRKESLDRYLQLLDKKNDLLDKSNKKKILKYPKEIGNLDLSLQIEADSLEMRFTGYPYDIKEFEISLLTYGAVAIFYLLKETFFNRSIFIWQYVFQDKVVLNKLYTIAYSGIANLHTHLAKFLSSPKVKLIAKNPVEFIILFRETLRENTLSSLILLYFEMGLLSLIEPIATSISDINKEVKKSGYRNPTFDQLEETLIMIKQMEETEAIAQEAKRKLQEVNSKDDELRRQVYEQKKRTQLMCIIKAKRNGKMTIQKIKDESDANEYIEILKNSTAYHYENLEIYIAATQRVEDRHIFTLLDEQQLPKRHKIMHSSNKNKIPKQREKKNKAK